VDQQDKGQPCTRTALQVEKQTQMRNIDTKLFPPSYEPVLLADEEKQRFQLLLTVLLPN